MMRSSHILALPPLPPEMIDDAIAEILLRLPPDDPACLVRASLVCKLWHRILSEPTFPDRYREFHGTPPLLGFLSGSYYTSGHDEFACPFFPVAATCIPFRQKRTGQVLDCRHGRVLLDHIDLTGTIWESLAVWDLVTGDHKVLRVPDLAADRFGHSGAVLCAAAGCNHRAGCHGGGPFQVLFVSTSYNEGTSVWVYSSETDAWSAPASMQIEYERLLVERERAAIVGDQIYFLLSSPRPGILKYDLGKGCLTVIVSPSTYTSYPLPGMLMAMEDGSLGFAGVKDDFTTLHLWVTKLNPNGGSLGWVQERVIPLNTCSQLIDVVGFAEGADILLLGDQDGRGFMFELKSERFTKLSKPEFYYYDDFVPYLSFYIPDFARHKQPLCTSAGKTITSKLKNYSTWTIYNSFKMGLVYTACLFQELCFAFKCAVLCWFKIKIE